MAARHLAGDRLRPIRFTVRQGMTSCMAVPTTIACGEEMTPIGFTEALEMTQSEAEVHRITFSVNQATIRCLLLMKPKPEMWELGIIYMEKKTVTFFTEP